MRRSSEYLSAAAATVTIAAGALAVNEVLLDRDEAARQAHNMEVEECYVDPTEMCLKELGVVFSSGFEVTGNGVSVPRDLVETEIASKTKAKEDRTERRTGVGFFGLLIPSMIYGSYKALRSPLKRLESERPAAARELNEKHSNV